MRTLTSHTSRDHERSLLHPSKINKALLSLPTGVESEEAKQETRTFITFYQEYGIPLTTESVQATWGIITQHSFPWKSGWYPWEPTEEPELSSNLSCNEVSYPHWGFNRDQRRGQVLNCHSIKNNKAACSFPPV